MSFEILTKVCTAGYKIGSEMMLNIIDNSPNMYTASGLAYCVAKMVPVMAINPLHASIFVGIAFVVHSAVKPLLNRAMGVDENGKPDGRVTLIHACNTMAFTALASTLLMLKITIIQGVVLTVMTYLVANELVKAIAPPKSI